LKVVTAPHEEGSITDVKSAQDAKNDCNVFINPHVDGSTIVLSLEHEENIKEALLTEPHVEGSVTDSNW